MRKSVFERIYEQYPERFPEKPSKKIQNRLWSSAYMLCARQWKKQHQTKPKKEQLEECLENRLIELLEAYQLYIEKKKERKLHKEISEALTPAGIKFNPISDKVLRQYREKEIQTESNWVRRTLNESLNQEFESRFCPVCKSNPCRCDSS